MNSLYLVKCDVCKEQIGDIYSPGDVDIGLQRTVAEKCPKCGWICCDRCNPNWDRDNYKPRICPNCTELVEVGQWVELKGLSQIWDMDNFNKWFSERESEPYVTHRKNLEEKMKLRSPES